jgi:hypothetical protein
MTFVSKYTKKITPTFIIVGLVGALIIAGSIWGYKKYSIYSEEKAQKVFADCMHEYTSVKAGQGSWATVDQLCSLGYNNHRGTAIAPYFLALQADSAIAQNKKGEALALLDIILKELSSSSPLYPVYATKRALLALDTSATEAEGLQQLEKLAFDKQNQQRDVALYYLGLYHWSHDALEQAKKVWQELIDMQKGQKVQSPWAARAQEKIQ